MLLLWHYYLFDLTFDVLSNERRMIKIAVLQKSVDAIVGYFTAVKWYVLATTSFLRRAPKDSMTSLRLAMTDVGKDRQSQHPVLFHFFSITFLHLSVSPRAFTTFAISFSSSFSFSPVRIAPPLWLIRMRSLCSASTLHNLFPTLSSESSNNCHYLSTKRASSSFAESFNLMSAYTVSASSRTGECPIFENFLVLILFNKYNTKT